MGRVQGLYQGVCYMSISVATMLRGRAEVINPYNHEANCQEVISIMVVTPTDIRTSMPNGKGQVEKGCRDTSGFISEDDMQIKGMRIPPVRKGRQVK
jgi:hypothetical protein